MKHLVGIFPLPEKRDNKAEVIPVPVDKKLKPFVVSGAQAHALLVGVAKHPFVYAALREGDISDFYSAAVQLVFDTSKEYNWGADHPHTLDGVRAALQHVRYYQFDGGEIIYTSPSDLFEEEEFEGVEVMKVPWLPENCAVVTPKDSSFVGGALIGGGYYVSVLHNVQRSIAVAWDQNLP